MTAVLEAGYPYELAGLVFYAFFLYMGSAGRRRGGVAYSTRTRILTILAAIGLVGAVPFHYAAVPAAIGSAVLVGIAALISAFADARF